MKFFKLTLACFIALVFFSCNSKNPTSNESPRLGSVSTENIKKNKSKLEIINSETLNEEFTKVYTMKKKDSTLIGDVYVKFVNDSLFTNLYIINNKDTLYSIKNNIFFKRNGEVDIEAGTDTYGYTFEIMRNDYFDINSWDKNGECAGDAAIIEWNYDDKIVEFLRTP